MAELLFIATTIFVAYVVFVVVGDKKDKSDQSRTASKPVVSSPEPVIAKAEAAQPVQVAVKATSKPTPAKSKTKAKAAPAKSSPAPVATDSLKNPKTGEIAKLPGNYAFAKRWIKDALVEEGLLDKVYKNSELDAAATAKIQDALQQLKAMAKYQ